MEEQNSNVAANDIYRDKKEQAIAVLLKSLDNNTKRLLVNLLQPNSIQMEVWNS